MDRFFRRLGIIAALALGILGVTATALALAFPGIDRALWQLILWGCGISLAGLILWFLWELNILFTNWRRNWEFRWPITKKQNTKADSPSAPESAATMDAGRSQELLSSLQSEARELRAEPRAPDDTIELIAAAPEPPPTDPKIIWKRKLRITLRNRSGKQIEARAPDWICSKGYVPFQAHPTSRFWSILQPEVSVGKWGKETQTLSLSPNEVFLASVALDESFSVDEINTRRTTRRVGMLALRVTMDGREMEWRTRL